MQWPTGIGSKPGEPKQQFGFEDLSGFLEFAKKEVGLTDQDHVRHIFEMFCKQVGPIPVAVAARASQLTVTMGEKLLRLHMGGDAQTARTIAETLNKSFFNHGYPLSRREAKEDIKLSIAEPDVQVEDLMWKIWLDIEKEFKARDIFNPLFEILSDQQQGPKLLRMVHQPIAAPFVQSQIIQNLQLPLIPVGQQPTMQIEVTRGGARSTVPANPLDVGQIIQSVRAASSVEIDPVDFELLSAIMESRRRVSHEWTRGKILACRTPEMIIHANAITISAGWKPVEIGEPPLAVPSNRDQ